MIEKKKYLLYSYIFSLSSAHLWLQHSSFIKPSKVKNLFVASEMHENFRPLMCFMRFGKR
jgi:hypothetical protein